MSSKRQVILVKQDKDLGRSIFKGLNECKLLERVSASSRVAIKPNLTYPSYKPGVTTSPRVIQETVRILKDYTHHIALVESDGGYGAWPATAAFEGHGFYDLCDRFGIELVNLSDEKREEITFSSRGRSYQIPLPCRLLYETDILITMPVPKVHCMTGLSLSYKNQWGCVPDHMRLRYHYLFDDAIVAINQALKPVVMGDGTYFLNSRGPMEGDPVRMDLIIAATDAGAFDLYVSELMGFPWQRVGHLRRAVELGDMPTQLEEIAFNISPAKARIFVSHMKRSFRNWIALAGFKSRFLTWFGYESWFGRVILHGILYAVAGKPIKP